MQCRLECDPGYESDLAPIFECTGGQYQPYHPTLFVCEPAVALVISGNGEREILSAGESTQCDQQLKTIPKLDMVGHSLNLLDNQLIMGPFFTVNEKTWWYLSLKNPRAGLLTNRWTSTLVEGLNAPGNHITFPFDKSLLYFGGDFKAQSLLKTRRKESGEWTLLKLLNSSNSEPFDKFTSHACSAKLDRNRFLVLGGTFISEDRSKSVLADIFEVDLRSEKVQKLGEMNHPRTQHACTMIPGSLSSKEGTKTFSRAILISGGVSETDKAETIVKVAELFVLDNRKSISLSHEMLEPRFKHHMVQLGEDILALGGQTQSQAGLKTIEKFNFDVYSNFETMAASGTWTTHRKSLKSNSSSSLAVTALPKSAVECNKESCQCGEPRASRIIGGTVVSSTF